MFLCWVQLGRFRGRTTVKECLLFHGFTVISPGSSVVWQKWAKSARRERNQEKLWYLSACKHRGTRFIVCVHLRVTQQGCIRVSPPARPQHAPPLVTQNPPQMSIGCKRRRQARPSSTTQSLLSMSWPEVQFTSDDESQVVCFRFCGKLIKANLLRFGSYLVSKDLKIRCDLNYLTVAYHHTRVKKERKNRMRWYSFSLRQSDIDVKNLAYLEWK